MNRIAGYVARRVRSCARSAKLPPDEVLTPRPYDTRSLRASRQITGGVATTALPSPSPTPSTWLAAIRDLASHIRPSPSSAEALDVAQLRDEVVYKRDPDGTPGHFGGPKQTRGPAHTGPDLRTLWSGRRDSNPRPPPWQGNPARPVASYPVPTHPFPQVGPWCRIGQDGPGDVRTTGL
jgi:hypothetical protein